MASLNPKPYTLVVHTLCPLNLNPPRKWYPRVAAHTTLEVKVWGVGFRAACLFSCNRQRKDPQPPEGPSAQGLGPETHGQAGQPHFEVAGPAQRSAARLQERAEALEEKNRVSIVLGNSDSGSAV